MTISYHQDFGDTGPYTTYPFASEWNTMVDKIGMSDNNLQIPAITTTVRDALTAANGMMIYNTTLNKFQVYENSAWTSLDTGTDTFLKLTDAPNSYSGEALKVVRVNSGESALEFATISSDALNSTNSSFTLTDDATDMTLTGDLGKLNFIQPDDIIFKPSGVTSNYFFTLTKINWQTQDWAGLIVETNGTGAWALKTDTSASGIWFIDSTNDNNYFSCGLDGDTNSILASSGTMKFKMSADLDDFIEFSTISNIPQISFSGGNGKIINVLDPTVAQGVATKNYVDLAIQGLDWQDSVLDRYDPTSGLPVGPSTGDRYISIATANGWTINNIYEYDGSSWDEITISEGMACWVEDEDINYVYNGSAWVKFGATITHANLSGLQGGTTSEYYHLTNAQHSGLTGTGAISNKINIQVNAADAFKIGNGSNDLLFFDTGNSILTVYDTTSTKNIQILHDGTNGVIRTLTGGLDFNNETIINFNLSYTLQEAFDAGQTITISDGDNQTFAITNNDTTNNPETMTITNTSFRNGLLIDQNNNTLYSNFYNHSAALKVDNSGNDNVGLSVIRVGHYGLSDNPLVYFVSHNNSSERGTILDMRSMGGGKLMYIRIDRGSFGIVNHGIDWEIEGNPSGGIYGFYVKGMGGTAWTQGNTSLVYFTQNHASSTQPALKVGHAGLGAPFLIVPQASEPTTSYEGELYVNSTSHAINYYNGTAWEIVGTSDGGTGGSGSAGAGNQYIELNIGGTTYKVLHDGTV